MRWVVLGIRFLHIVVISAWMIAAWCVRRLFLMGGSVDEKEQLLGRYLARLLSHLGATFIKFGQILSTRPDLLPPGVIQELSRLQDDVPPLRFERVRAVLASELDDEWPSRLSEFEETPVAAASVAQVHRARLSDGRSVAVKVQRPEARSQIERDLLILGFWARLLDRIPSIRMLSLPGSVERFGHALTGQLDFTQEARNNRRFATAFADVPNVDVPGLVEELCTPRVLVMDFVEGVKATQPEKVGGDRAKLARTGGEAVLKMIFNDGFVHADLHPGNIILTGDDRVVLIDLGMVSEIPQELLRPWVETFIALSQRDGETAARLFFTYAPTVGNTDYAAFCADVKRHLDSLYGKRLGEVEISAAVSGMMNVLRKHHVQIDPAFTVVNIALLVAEGLGKQLDPEIDLVPLAQPYLAMAMLSAPPARAPHRTVPAAA
ncbi:MAG: AarF/UbiB family protein [Polyangiaceae bacterium]